MVGDGNKLVPDSLDDGRQSLNATLARLELML